MDDLGAHSNSGDDMSTSSLFASTQNINNSNDYASGQAELIGFLPSIHPSASQSASQSAIVFLQVNPTSPFAVVSQLSRAGNSN